MWQTNGMRTKRIGKYNKCQNIEQKNRNGNHSNGVLLCAAYHLHIAFISLSFFLFLFICSVIVFCENKDLDLCFGTSSKRLETGKEKFKWSVSNSFSFIRISHSINMKCKILSEEFKWRNIWFSTEQNRGISNIQRFEALKLIKNTLNKFKI